MTGIPAHDLVTLVVWAARHPPGGGAVVPVGVTTGRELSAPGRRIRRGRADNCVSWLPARMQNADVLRRLALASLVVNVVIVVTGGAVRLTGSGLGCPTWPRAPTPR